MSTIVHYPPLHINNHQDAKTNGKSQIHLLHMQPAVTDQGHGVQLTKEDEQAAGDEIEVRREDQDKINKFSRLHQRELKYEEELQVISVRILYRSSMFSGYGS